MAGTQDTASLAELIDRKLRILESLRGLAEKQIPMVKAGEATQLMRLLAAKQKALAQLQEVERDLDPFRSQDPSQRKWGTTQARASCREQADRCVMVAADIIRLEQQSEEGAIRRRDDVAALWRIPAAAEADQAYASGSIGAGRHLSLRIEG